ncbi:hypothetical protein BGZ83_000896 [Gryganskiella cystojenkinii]|nr:hypothetical protein BGZ83_000896 [Gryganskiella cystojenkinii]
MVCRSKRTASPRQSVSYSGAHRRGSMVTKSSDSAESTKDPKNGVFPRNSIAFDDSSSKVDQTKNLDGDFNSLVREKAQLQAQLLEAVAIEKVTSETILKSEHAHYPTAIFSNRVPQEDKIKAAVKSLEEEVQVGMQINAKVQ